jgi:DNA-binding transcriptional LysR family regulator
VTQSAVSKQIRTLEDWLKLPLFERLVRGIQPTPAGLALQREVAPCCNRCCVACTAAGRA